MANWRAVMIHTETCSSPVVLNLFVIVFDQSTKPFEHLPPTPGARDTPDVQMVLSIDQTRLQKGFKFLKHS